MHKTKINKSIFDPGPSKAKIDRKESKMGIEKSLR